MRVLIVLLSLFLLTGCWDRKELAEIGIVSAISIDKDTATNEYTLTSEYLRPSAQSTLSPSPDESSLRVSVTGKTIDEILLKANKTIDRKSFYAHNKVIVISEEIAREGLIPIIDSFQRGKQVRGYVWLAITKGSDAKTIINTKGNNITPVSANFLKGLFENADYNAVGINMLTYQKKVLGAGIDPLVGVLMREENEDKVPAELVKLSGGAVFKEDKLVGFIDETEVRGYNLVTGEGPITDRGSLPLPSLLDEDKLVTLLLKELKSEIKPKVDKNGQISFTIDIQQKARLSGQESTDEFKSRKEISDYLKEIEKEGEKTIKKEIEMVIDKAQQDFQSDIFGFGRVLNKKRA